MWAMIAKLRIWLCGPVVIARCLTDAPTSGKRADRYAERKRAGEKGTTGQLSAAVVGFPFASPYGRGGKTIALLKGDMRFEAPPTQPPRSRPPRCRRPSIRRSAAWR